jgi:hypothetical protein
MQNRREIKMDDIDKENERRRSIFDSGRDANGRGLGFGANPHHSPLEWEIWNNGWWFAEHSGDRERQEARRVLMWGAVVLIIGALLIFLF